jgi:hypothetical protein
MPSGLAFWIGLVASAIAPMAITARIMVAMVDNGEIF